MADVAQPRSFAPSKEDVLTVRAHNPLAWLPLSACHGPPTDPRLPLTSQTLAYFFGAPVSPEKLKNCAPHPAKHTRLPPTGRLQWTHACFCSLVHRRGAPRAGKLRPLAPSLVRTTPACALWRDTDRRPPLRVRPIIFLVRRRQLKPRNARTHASPYLSTHRLPPAAPPPFGASTTDAYYGQNTCAALRAYRPAPSQTRSHCRRPLHPAPPPRATHTLSDFCRRWLPW